MKLPAFLAGCCVAFTLASFLVYIRTAPQPAPVASTPPPAPVISFQPEERLIGVPEAALPPGLAFVRFPTYGFFLEKIGPRYVYGTTEVQVVDIGPGIGLDQITPSQVIDALATRDNEIRHRQPELSLGYNAELLPQHCLAFRTHDDDMGVLFLEDAKQGARETFIVRLRLLQITGAAHPRLARAIDNLNEAKEHATDAQSLNAADRTLQAEGGHTRYHHHREHALGAIEDALSDEGTKDKEKRNAAINLALLEIQRALLTAASFEKAQENDARLTSSTDASRSDDVPTPAIGVQDAGR